MATLRTPAESWTSRWHTKEAVDGIVVEKGARLGWFSKDHALRLEEKTSQNPEKCEGWTLDQRMARQD